MLRTSLKISRFVKPTGVFAFLILVFLVLSVNSFALTIDLIAGQHTVVGDVTVTDNGGINVPATKLFVTYRTTGNWYMSTTHLDVESTPNAIPQSNGNPVPGRFRFKTDHNPVVTTFTYEVPIAAPLIPLLEDGKVYIAAHADVHNGYITLAASPSGTVNIIAYPSSGHGYFDVNISGLGLDGTYSVYCIEPAIGMYTDVNYTSKMVSSYDPNAMIPVNYPKNLELVNFIFNQDIVRSGTYTYGDIQAAIWYLLSWYSSDARYTLENGELLLKGISKPISILAYLNYELGNGWNLDRTLNIINLAKTCPSGYTPPPNGYMVIAFVNPYNGVEGFGQSFIIIIPVPSGGSETAWGGKLKGTTVAGIYDFTGSNWAMYFEYTSPYLPKASVITAITGSNKKKK